MPRIPYLFLLLTLLIAPLSAKESRVDRLSRLKVLRVGTTADYRPFTSLQGDKYVGYDVEIARLLAKDLEIDLVFIPTTWAKLVEDLEADRFDLAVGGITRTLPRQLRVGFTDPIFFIGKCPLVRVEDRTRFASLEAIDCPDVRIGVNPGGTNEKYVRENCSKAQIKVIDDNLAIPGLVAEGVVDVMLTDNVEAVLAAKKDPRLAAVSPGAPWTSETLAFMTPRDDQAFINLLNLFLFQAEADGRLPALRRRYGLEEVQPATDNQGE